MNMKMATLDHYRFSGLHKSHIGAIKSCLDYFDIGCTPAWVYGMTGNAFMMVVDEHLSAPNIGEPEEEMFKLARHLGLDIQGFHTFGDAVSFKTMQSKAWDMARRALDQGLPVFAKELDLGNETSVIYAYDKEGYFTHSWHGGKGHEGSEAMIPWTKLGRNYCPCSSCRAKANQDMGEWANDSVYIGDPPDGGFISLHYASKAEPADDRIALQEAIRFALKFSRQPEYNWGGRTFYSGAAAYNRWVEAVRSNTIEGFYMGYFADLGHESRRLAHRFLQEASERFNGELAMQLAHAAKHYMQLRDAFSELNQLFPWSQPHAPIEDPDRRQQAMELLQRIKQLDMEGWGILEKVEAAI